MKYPVHVEGKELVAALDRVLQFLGNSQHILFNVMAQLTVGQKSPFNAPGTSASANELLKKRKEIAVILESPMLLRGLELALKIFEGTYREVDSMGGIPGRSPGDLLKCLCLTTDRPGETISLSKEGRWIVEWPMRPGRNGSDIKLSCDWLSRDWGFVVPPYVVNYLSAAAIAHHHERNDVALALLSIAAEATLRDVLSSLGYSFAHGASPVDVYTYGRAHVTADASAGNYLVKFIDPPPITPSAFGTSFPSGGVEIKVRRVFKRTAGGTERIDLQLMAPMPFPDHWSGTSIDTPAVQSITGLGAALNIARNQEHCITPEDLAVDADEVLQAVRNNLVHLSGGALDTRLPPYDSLKSGGNFTLRDFVENDRLVQDFILAISRFVTDQYVRLRRSGTLFNS